MVLLINSCFLLYFMIFNLFDYYFVNIVIIFIIKYDIIYNIIRNGVLFI